MISLYTATVPAFLQIIAASQGVVAKGLAFAAEQGIDPATLVEARLAPDMLPFAYQIQSLRTHSIGGIEGVRAGEFHPYRGPVPADFAGLIALLDDTAAALAALDPAAVDGLAGADVAFVFGNFRMDYTGADFLLSFSLPNFHFHASIAYAILRGAGVPLGKRDFLGRPRIKA